jgi:hypothetical protein
MTVVIGICGLKFMVDFFVVGVVKRVLLIELMFLEVFLSLLMRRPPPVSLCGLWFLINHVGFRQVEDEEDTVAEKEKEKEGLDEEQPEKEDADDENDVADRRPTLQRNYNTDDSHLLSSVDPQVRMKDGPLSDVNKARPYPHIEHPREFCHRDRGFLVRVSTPASQQVCVFWC